MVPIISGRHSVLLALPQRNIVRPDTIRLLKLGCGVLVITAVLAWLILTAAKQLAWYW